MENNTFLAARDHIGIIPMYVGKSSSGAVFVSSELKVIHDECVEVDILKPGCLIDNSGV